MFSLTFNHEFSKQKLSSKIVYVKEGLRFKRTESRHFLSFNSKDKRILYKRICGHKLVEN